jgi:hypothetical protein
METIDVKYLPEEFLTLRDFQAARATEILHRAAISKSQTLAAPVYKTGCCSVSSRSFITRPARLSLCRYNVITAQ